ncbi:MAG: hypothetical protein Q9209_005526 [Squamulea sp. 1 TL-2023]
MRAISAEDAMHEVQETRTPLGIDSASRGNTLDANDLMMTADIGNIDEITNILPNHDGQLAWFPSAQDSWSVPLSAAAFDTPFSSVLGSNGPEQWSVYTATSAQIPAPFTVPTTTDGAPMLPPANGPQRLAGTVWDGVEPRDRIEPSTAAHSPASSSRSTRSSAADHVADLQNALTKDSPATKQLVQVFFSAIHPHWPILHAPTFNIEDASHDLLGSMLILASWLQDRSDHVELAPLVFDAVTATLLGPSPSSGSNIQPAPLHTLQALLLCIVYTTTKEGILARAVHLNSILISHCRHQGVFNGQYTDRDTEDSEISPFASWLAQEQLHRYFTPFICLDVGSLTVSFYYADGVRLAFSILRIDAYLSLLIDHPPSVRYQEMSIPLPKSTHLWTAAGEDERRALQWNEPAGREKTRFCFLMRDALDQGSRHQRPYPLTEIDYHLGLCSFQAGIWETAREAHSCDFDELIASSRPRDHVVKWRSHLDLWRANMENDCQLWQNYFSASTKSADHKCAPLSIILWHYSALILHAPLKLLQGQGCCYKCRSGTSGATGKNKARYRGWLESSCARIAVWHAAQIVKVVAMEFANATFATRLRLNPLAIAGLLKSAMVVCSYAFHTKACPVCTNGPPIDLVYLFDASEDDERLVRWKEHGEGLADWGPLAAPVCRCKVPQLANWFLGPLAKDKSAEAEFRAFLDGLGKI